MLKLIVNGDDFGLNQNVNEAIVKSFRHGILRSTSLIANGKSFDSALEIIRANPELDVGAHITLVGEKTILDQNKLPSLLDADGNPPKHAIDFAKKYYCKSFSLQEIKLEITEQIKKLFDVGIKITHIDSHQHIHMLPAILDITIELSRKYKIKYVRFPREEFKLHLFRNLKSINRIMQLITLNYFAKKVKEEIFVKTDYFSGFFLGGRLSKTNLLALIRTLPAEGVCELMCHPGLANNSNTALNTQYRLVEEMDALTNPEIFKFLSEKNIRLISFRDIM